MEYMALRKPSIVTDGGGIRELMEDEKTGFIIPPKSEIKLAEKINYLLDNKEVAKKMGDESRKIIIEKFSLDNSLKILMNLFNSLISNR